MSAIAIGLQDVMLMGSSEHPLPVFTPPRRNNSEGGMMWRSNNKDAAFLTQGLKDLEYNLCRADILGRLPI
jgi:hypothetical protein